MKPNSARPASSARSRPPWESEALFRALAEASEDLVAVVEGDGRFLFVNAGAARILGEERGELVNRSVFDLVHPEDRAATEAVFRGWSATDPTAATGFENRLVRRDSHIRRMLWWATRLERQGSGVLVVIARDMTELRASERLHAEQELRLRLLLQGMLDAVVAIDAYGTVRFTSDSVRDLFGWAPDELVGRNVKVLMPEPHASLHDDYLARYRETQETWILNTTREFEALHRDGRRFWIEISVARIDVPGDGPLFCGAFRDISERKAAERRIKESEQRFRAIFDQEFQLVGLLAPSGLVLEMNRAAIQLIGATREDVVGRLFWETPWWSGSVEMPQTCREWVRRAARGEFVRDQVRIRSRSGELRTMDFSLKPVRGEEGRVELLIPEGRDITELKRAQERETGILRALAEIGESASLLAHEIKNPITSINLALRAVANRLGEDERSLLDDLLARLRKLEATLRRTLSFAKPLDLCPETCAVLPLLIDPVEQLRPEAEARRIDLTLDVARDCGSVAVDAGLIGGLVGNLLRNALDAVPDGGRVRVRAERSARRGVLVRVEDDGPGIAESVRETLFQPFVTTKANGTGLGLPLARKVAEQHGGSLAVGRSADLGGACFELELPGAAGPARPAAH